MEQETSVAHTFGLLHHRVQLEREIRIHSALMHENIVRMFTHFEDDKCYYIVQVSMASAAAGSSKAAHVPSWMLGTASELCCHTLAMRQCHAFRHAFVISSSSSFSVVNGLPGSSDWHH